MPTRMDTQRFVEFLETVGALKEVPTASLLKIAEVLKEVTYKEGEYIVRQGEHGDTFYILQHGCADVTRTSSEAGDPVFLRVLTPGAYFGEKALMGDSMRTANVVAGKGGCTCLILGKESFAMVSGSFTFRIYK